MIDRQGHHERLLWMEGKVEVEAESGYSLEEAGRLGRYCQAATQSQRSKETPSHLI